MMKLLDHMAQLLRVFVFWILMLGYHVALFGDGKLSTLLVYTFLAVFIGVDWKEQKNDRNT